MSEGDTCVKCNESITTDRAGCTAQNKKYHLVCFTCSACECQLAGGSFYCIDGKLYCEKDYIETLDKCAVCNEAIVGKLIRASGKALHSECFTCPGCKTPLAGKSFIPDDENQLFCPPCYHKTYGARCTVCEQPIIPEEGDEDSKEIIAMDKSFHASCYKCEDCGLKLTSKKEGCACYPIDGYLYCKKCSTERMTKK